jgi:hypothetical protein
MFNNLLFQLLTSLLDKNELENAQRFLEHEASQNLVSCNQCYLKSPAFIFSSYFLDWIYQSFIRNSEAWRQWARGTHASWYSAEECSFLKRP